MDYTTQALSFRVRKALRYARLYGVRRTLAKIKGQYHMRRRFTALPQMPVSPPGEGSIGIIGCGNYAFSTLAYYIDSNFRGALRAVMDSDVHRAASLAESYGLGRYGDDARTIIDDPEVRLVFIASNHATHAEYAIRCIRAGKHVHIEKPHVVSQDQLEALLQAMRECPSSKVFLGFNRPRSRLFKELQGHLDREDGPLMINWFIAGHEIPDDHWYFDAKEGGRVLGNLCHWTDLTLHLVSLDKAFPCSIVPATPAHAKSDYVVSMVFADRSCATITFSCKGHTFEGVREVLNVHKGNVLANLTDFERLNVDVVERRYSRSLAFRDHGHEANVVNSCSGLGDHGSAGESPRYVQATGMLFLAIKEAIESGKRVELTREAALGALSTEASRP